MCSIYRAANHATKINDAFRARSILVSSIRLNSKVPDTWIWLLYYVLIIDIFFYSLALLEKEDNRIEEARVIFKVFYQVCV